MIDLILRDVAIEGAGRVDVAVAAGRIEVVAPHLPHLPHRAAIEVDGRGGALIPGLWDHHVHLFATAARAGSLSVAGLDYAGFAAALKAASRAGGDLRLVDYDEGAIGPLDAAALDAIVRDVQVRVQHRTGALWVLNGAALAGLGTAALPPGAERDASGRSNGRFVREDAWLRARLPARPPSLAPLATLFARTGVIGVTDATVTTDAAGARRLAEAAAAGGLRQHLWLMSGCPDLPADPRYVVGPVKIVLDDARLPPPEEVAAAIAAGHGAGRAAAIHCVTAAELAVALAGFAMAGARPGDRIEHGGVVDPAGAAAIAALGLTVVTQPGFISARGDRYLATVAADDLPHLYPCASLLAAGVAVGGSSDAPYGPLDPWAGMRAAVMRTTAGGSRLGAKEAVTPRRALGLWLGAPDAPGGPERRVAVGAAADLCLLHCGLDEALAALSADVVRHTIVAGIVA